MIALYHFDRRSKHVLRLSSALFLVLLMTCVSASVAQQTGSAVPPNLLPPNLLPPGVGPTNIGSADGRQITLRQQLTYGLRAFTKADFAFIDKVILAVEQGRLPREMVDSTFLWARDRAARRSYQRRLRPMVYFAPGLTRRAKHINVRL